VLDAASARAPGGWRWSSAAAFFAAGMAVPVAALQFVNPTIASAEDAGRFAAKSAASATTAEHAAMAGSAAAADAVASAVTTSITSATHDVLALHGRDGSSVVKPNGEVMMTSPSGATVRVFPPDAKGHRRTVLTSASGRVVEYADARSVPGFVVPPRPPRPPASPHTAIERAVQYKVLGVTPEYAAAMRGAVPGIDEDAIVQLKAVGVSPAYVRDLAGSGYRGLDADEIVQARALGIDGAYIRAMLRAGYSHLTMDELVEMKAVGVTAADVARFRRAGHGVPSVDDIVEMKTVGVEPEDLDSR
jgi:hypothetical protein